MDLFCTTQNEWHILAKIPQRPSAFEIIDFLVEVTIEIYDFPGTIIYHYFLYPKFVCTRMRFILKLKEFPLGVLEER